MVRFLLPIAIMVGLALPAQAQQDPIVVYNAQHETLAQEWATAFTETTGIPVIIRQGADLEVANQIVQEGANSPADVFLTENSPGMVLVNNAGLFAPLPQDILDRIPQSFRSADGHWTGIAARSTVLAYNTSSLTEADLPASLSELADPAWSGRWAASPSGADFQAIVAAYLALQGEDETRRWLEAMRNNAVIVRGNRAAMAAANNGEVDAALIYHYYWFGDQAGTGESSGNVALHYFGNRDPGAFVSVSGAGVLASSQHQDEAFEFVRFITGPQGQGILRDGASFEYAIAIDAQSNPALPPLSGLDAPELDPGSLDTVRASALMTEAGLF